MSSSLEFVDLDEEALYIAPPAFVEPQKGAPNYCNLWFSCSPTSGRGAAVFHEHYSKIFFPFQFLCLLCLLFWTSRKPSVFVFFSNLDWKTFEQTTLATKKEIEWDAI